LRAQAFVVKELAELEETNLDLMRKLGINF
jgi:hypothetical protein